MKATRYVHDAVMSQLQVPRELKEKEQKIYNQFN